MLGVTVLQEMIAMRTMITRLLYRIADALDNDEPTAPQTAAELAARLGDTTWA
jgi:hypothetical protein